MDVFSQNETIFFSVTGDTVCYSNVFGQSVDSLHISHTTYIQRRDKIGSVKTISFFQLICESSNKCIETLNGDTVKKYHLQLDGKPTNIWTNKDFVVSVKPLNTHMVDISAFGPKYIFQTTVSVDISCKGQNIYTKTFDIMFKGESPKDFPERDIVRISAWHKKNKGKYFVDLSIKECQTFKKPTDTPDYGFKSFKLIL
jgi:hypothetical protein